VRRTVLGVLICLLLASSLASAADRLRLGLDFFPNPNHVPIYLAQSSGLFRDRDLAIEIVVPANPSDPVKLAASRYLDVALTPQINYFMARSEGLPLVAVGALIDSPLGGILGLAESGVQTMSDLAGRRIGYSLAPLEPILWETMLECEGVPLDDVELINVGYSTMPALLTGSVAAIGAFRNYEPIQAELQGFTPVFFPQEASCIPMTFDLILVAHPETVRERTAELRRLLEGLAVAVQQTVASPDDALTQFFSANLSLDDEVDRRSFELTVPLFADGLRHDNETVWSELQTYLFESELIGTVFALEELYTVDLLANDERGEDG